MRKHEGMVKGSRAITEWETGHEGLAERMKGKEQGGEKGLGEDGKG